MTRRRYPCEPTGPVKSELDKFIDRRQQQIAQGFWRPKLPTRPHYQESVEKDTPARCPTCGAVVPTIFEHVDGCPDDEPDTPE